MTNIIEPFMPYGTGNLSKIEQAQKNINSLQKESGIGVTRQSGNSKEDELDARDLRLKKAARDFEEIFVTFMIKDMWKTSPSDEESEMPGGNIYMEMAQSALAGELVKGEGLGIGKMLYEQMKNKMGSGNNAEKSINEHNNEK